jgi:hypothetical protein
LIKLELLSDKFFFSFVCSVSDGTAIRRVIVSVLTIGDGISVLDEGSGTVGIIGWGELILGPETFVVGGISVEGVLATTGLTVSLLIRFVTGAIGK